MSVVAWRYETKVYTYVLMIKNCEWKCDRYS